MREVAYLHLWMSTIRLWVSSIPAPSGQVAEPEPQSRSDVQPVGTSHHRGTKAANCFIPVPSAGGMLRLEASPLMLRPASPDN